MPEEQLILQPLPGAAGDGLERLAAAVTRLESLLERSLAEQDALRREHEKLKLDYQALKARTVTIGDEMDVTIGRLKEWMSADNAKESEGGLWAK